MNSLATHPQPGRILWELACCVASAVGADGFVLHLADPQSNMLHVFRRYSVYYLHCHLNVTKLVINLFSCDTESVIDDAIFNLKTENDLEDIDKDSGSYLLNSSEQDHTVASYVAKHRHTVTVQDIRRPDSRFPAGSICLQVGRIKNICMKLFI